ncbi:MAG: DUF2853 family protein [Verrucomicrobia bacterium]|nr:DUF2853 family protein [Verrucomicrobiota bacterium]
MSKFDDALDTYRLCLREVIKAESVNDHLLTAVTRNLGPVIYDADASIVAGSDPKEVERVRTSFLIGKLGLPDGPELNTAIAATIKRFGASNPKKYRAVIHYLLVQHFEKENIFA